ncbi:MAG TPA: hypothetical protein VMZ33_06665 [Candidatus Limnocylindrales bacterium]|nr:hypothetical protein [Candidatus Limnocylindrales bacterium]
MDDERIQRLEARLEELDRRNTSLERAMDKAMDRSRAAMDTIVPNDTRRHMRAAWRENLLAVRSLIDFWADRLADDRSGSDSANTSNGQRETIKID